MVCNADAGEVAIRKTKFRRLSSTRGFKTKDISHVDIYKTGWVRVHDGPEPFVSSNKSRLVNIKLQTTTTEIKDILSLPNDLTVWSQIGGDKSKRLNDEDCPFQIQEEFLKRLGYSDATRRIRLGIDPELKFAFRFHVGPAGPEPSGSYKGGVLLVLKGLVFPQWRLRSAVVIGNRFLVYSECSDRDSTILKLRGAHVSLCLPKSRRLVLQVTSLNNEHLYLGFRTQWERNLWFAWLTEGCLKDKNNINSTMRSQDDNQLIPRKLSESLIKVKNQGLKLENMMGECLDLSCAGAKQIPESLFQAAASNTQLLLLNDNSLTSFPLEIFDLTSLTLLDLSHNSISKIPDDIRELDKLQELRLDGNCLNDLPEVIGELKSLRTLISASNRIEATLLRDVNDYRCKIIMELRQDLIMKDYEKQTCCENGLKKHCRAPLDKIDLRNNHLKGSIILGNYESLTHLDVSDNAVTRLDLSALRGLRTLRCARNKLRHLILHGTLIQHLDANNNELEQLDVSSNPSSLEHINLSQNNLSSLPYWLSSCDTLKEIYADRNQLTTLHEQFFALQTLRRVSLGHNRLVSLPPLRNTSVVELRLHDNILRKLPDNFFNACNQLLSLNLARNRLRQLPSPSTTHPLRRFIISVNRLTGEGIHPIFIFKRLRIFRAAYNLIEHLPDDIAAIWPDLEELVISGNRLKELPRSLSSLHQLKILRVHSNRLKSVPVLAENASLRVLDLAHNELDAVNLVSIASKRLQFLDISCNSNLKVDPRQFHMYRAHRPLSLVDTSGQNRSSLPSKTLPQYDALNILPWKLGFSETLGNQKELCVSQIRLPNFCNAEGLFGIIDGHSDSGIPRLLEKVIPGILLEEKAIKETCSDYMKYTILSAHRELKEKGQKNCASITLCHLCIEQNQQGFGSNSGKLVLRVASVGEAAVVLGRASGPIRLTSENNRKIGFFPQFPSVIPNPETIQVTIEDSDEFLIVGNKYLWESIDITTAVNEVRGEKNEILAAKKLQDYAQSYGNEENISVIVVKFSDIDSDVDILMKELKNTIKKTQSECCCEKNICIHGHVLSERSSPSGQSDQACEVQQNNRQNQNQNNMQKAPFLPNNTRQSCRGVARAIRARVEEEFERDKEDTDSALSEEQFKCWEYMLEQNTQLLFDKELDTLSSGISRPASTLQSIRKLSHSSPQLSAASTQTKNIPPVIPTPLYASTAPFPFLSRHFSSTRWGRTQDLKADIRFGSGRASNIRLLQGGRNSAYFGSLQRLAPYNNLEYDFAVMQERPHDSIDHEGRMQQYWGIASTEL